MDSVPSIVEFKVEKFLKGSLDSIPSPSSSVKIQINPKRCGLFGQLRRRGGGLKVPAER